MIVLITGATHTGKTLLAQKLLQKYHFPYLSIDHLKMGLIRSGQTALTPTSTEKELTAYLWPIVREMIKTAMENDQDLIVEGCYIPFDWECSFENRYRTQIRAIRLILSKEYIENHFEDILAHASDVEKRLDDSCCTKQWLIEENQKELSQSVLHHCPYILIEEDYDVAEAAKTFFKLEHALCV